MDHLGADATFTDQEALVDQFWMARLMVGRDNPNCSAKLISLSSRSPGARSPSLIADSIC